MPNSEPARVSLEPCPFCGNPPWDTPQNGYVESASSPSGFLVAVHCGCGANGAERGSDAEAIDAWNRRRSSTPPTSPGWQDYERGLEDAARVADEVDKDCKQYPSVAERRASAFWARAIATAIRALKSPAAPECGR